MPAFCIACCKVKHEQTPFHHIEQWVGTHWATSWLINVGTEIHLGHNGAKCPNIGSWRCTMDASDKDDWTDVEIPLAGEELDVAASADALRTAEGTSALPAESEGNIVNIVDVSGVHQLVVRPCRCASNNDRDDVQLLRMGLFPASFEVFKTAFTLRVLEDFRWDNLVCNTTAYQYYNKIRKVTSPAFPHTVPV